jgi:hypothetical protein
LDFVLDFLENFRFFGKFWILDFLEYLGFLENLGFFGKISRDSICIWGLRKKLFSKWDYLEK